jgi:hypothetical protein
MKSWILPSGQDLGLIVGLVMAAATWLSMKSSLSLLNWVGIGFLLLAATLAFEALSIQGTIQTYRRNKLMNKLTSFQSR